MFYLPKYETEKIIKKIFIGYFYNLFRFIEENDKKIHENKQLF